MKKFFDTLQDKEFIFAPQCYKTCNGGCCHNIHAQYFKFNKSSAVILPMLEVEYLSLKQAGNTYLENGKVNTLTLKNGKKINIYFAKCDLKGLCNPHSLRPLICKLYPYYPQVDYDGNFLGVKPCALFDIFYKDAQKHYCTITHKKSDDFLKEFEQNTQVLRREPIMIFVFKALEVVEETLKQYTYDHYGKAVYLEELTHEEKFDFFAFQEINSMTMQAYRNEKFISKIQDIYDNLEVRYQEQFTKYFNN
ncbi:hypothetical protein IO395_001488 [Campylobacter lari]|uniref:hypothetical protein n=1 Tax=Campylobacter lari TaxID=201 RepID=UPI001D9DC174|nr:hypothetical protein [Campylobacter lari]EGK8007577.1 hypothetical protein [Campylobacter lari]EHL8053279.1 hypothetical protein [Campylobacter lari]MCR2074875.1 hypothetical protein [Campylobacter lari subsp. concheus]